MDNVYVIRISEEKIAMKKYVWMIALATEFVMTNKSVNAKKDFMKPIAQRKLAKIIAIIEDIAMMEFVSAKMV